MPSPDLSSRPTLVRSGGRLAACILALTAPTFPGRAAADPGSLVQSTWPDTIHYRATFVSPAATTGSLHVAAVDQYEVFFNGVRVGADSLWTRMTAHEVGVASGDNDIGIAVVNRGAGAGNGVMAAVVAGDSILARTTTNQRIQAWRWSADPQQGTEWTMGAVEDRQGWQVVQEGAMDTSRVAYGGLAEGLPAVIAGLPGGVDLGSVAGGVILGRIKGVNLALGKPSNHPEVVDGNLAKGWNAPASALSFSADVDLQDRRLIHKVRVITLGRNDREFEENSLRGYSVQVSDDQIRWTEVGVRHDIGCMPWKRSPCSGADADPSQYPWTEVEFRPTWTRFVRFVIVDINPGSRPAIAEFEVFGDGFAEEGVYLSRPLDLGAPAGSKNLGRLRWEATVPERTSLSIEVRTGDSLAAAADGRRLFVSASGDSLAKFAAAADTLELAVFTRDGGWSAPDSNGAWFPAAEPGRLLQYRLHLATHDQDLTPVFEHLEVDFDTEVAASTALYPAGPGLLHRRATRGRVTPNRVAMGEEQLFVYHLDLELEADDLGVERLRIDVPSAARLAEGAAVGELLSAWESTQRHLTLTFAEPLAEAMGLEIPFLTRTHASAHEFRAALFSPGSQNPLNAAENRGRDPETDEPWSWSVATSTTREDALSQVRAEPPVITPNGDGINDRTVIEFILSVVDRPRRVSIRIFDLGGRPVRDLSPPPVAAGAYLGPGAPGTWDGTDAAGRTVPPGLYLYRVEADLDTGNETRSGVVAVAY